VLPRHATAARRKSQVTSHADIHAKNTRIRARVRVNIAKYTLSFSSSLFQRGQRTQVFKLVYIPLPGNTGLNLLALHSHEWALNGPHSNNPPPMPKREKEGKKDHCIIVLLIYQSFSISPVRVELTPRKSRFNFPQLMNGLCLEFTVLCGQISLEIATDTRLLKQPRLNRAFMVCSHIFS
jgi:hypothetical protein